MFSRFMLTFLTMIIIALCGCAKKVQLESMYSDHSTLSYNDLKKIFTEKGRLEWEGGHADMYAIILHHSMNKYRGDVPSKGTAIEFSSDEPITIARYIVTVNINGQPEYIISGIGTDNCLINGKKDSSVGYKPVTIAGPRVNSFILYSLLV